MKRQYISIADQFAPFDGAHFLSGLGSGHTEQFWPNGRSYWSTANFRAPYDHGYFQDNNLMGLGTIGEQIPKAVFVLTCVGALYIALRAGKKKK